MPRHKQAAGKLTRKQAKARTRRKLIDALLEISREQGIGALSTTKIARRAGVAQSVFYDHFSDMNDALTVVAAQVGERVRAAMSSEREKIELADPMAALRATYAAGIDGLLAEPMLAELLLRYRRDPDSPLGGCIRGILDDARAEIIGDMERLGLGKRLPHVDLHAELFIAMALRVVEGVLDGTRDRDACLDVLTRITAASMAR
jgi:AcrR family transcriptional regulator